MRDLAQCLVLLNSLAVAGSRLWYLAVIFLPLRSVLAAQKRKLLRAMKEGGSQG
jgi:hypothetical protein